MVSDQQLQDLYAATVVSNDGDKIGRVEQVYLDDTSGEPEWVTVKTGLFGSAQSFVPLAAASLDGDRIRVPYLKDRVKDAPRVEQDSDLSPEQENELYRHYGLDGGAGGQAGENTDAGEAAPGAAGGTPGYATGREDQLGRETGAGDRPPRGTGRDTSGPNTDDAMTRSEERVSFGTQQRESGRARLRKHVVTDRVTEEVPVSREEAVVEREPITDANRGDAVAGGDLTEEEHEVTLHEERAVVDKETVPVERVRLGTETVADTETVSADRRREEIEVDGDATDGGTAGRGTGDADRR
ncbi:DUF2382 domain-containing protein [Pseudokineococcus marinus]|uniref:PRC and DUF2382 domain-containing protein n=1 Tax=Pseudokineococcus marinus TaxID=351215 RepID=A0A849BM78_9ACTN|nr:PRC and DUF2382 domain-containing protein [Pseudokineococcus marinus]NNH22157.1 PRC and DUF2382 domain-containing protein [Pseudokineococcus marinus]